MLTPSQYASLVEEKIRTLTVGMQPTGLFEPIAYALEAGGKRIRPMLTLAAADALGTPPDDAVNQALAIEIFHNFTLVHDDVMDNADLRRGHQTVRRKWDDETAILSGDAMLTLATETLLQNPGGSPLHLLSEFNRTAMDVYRGQQLDMEFETRDKVTTAEYLEMIRLKTSELLAGACAVGAIRAGADEAATDTFRRFGLYLGLAFQLRDDYLDTFGDPLTFGKQIGGDIVNNKKTWLHIIASQEAPEAMLKATTDRSADNDQKIAAVTEIYRSLELPARLGRHVKDYVDLAIASIAEANLNSEATKFFTDLALSTVKRDI